MILAGQRWEQLGLRERLDVARAAIAEPAVHGSFSSLDEILTTIEDLLVEVLPDRDTFGTSRAAQEQTARAEELWPAAAPKQAASTIPGQ